MQRFTAAGAAVLAGAALAAVTAFGVVSTVSETTAQPERDVVDYGTTTAAD